MKGNVSFDMDGVLANFSREFLRVAHTMFDTPVGGHLVQKTWMFEDFPEFGLTKAMVNEVWGKVGVDPSFWVRLDPFNPSIMHKINRMTNRIFITNRVGIDPHGQSVRFLERWGVVCPKVFIAANKVPTAVQMGVVAHLDDLYGNCVEIKRALPTAYVALLWVGYNEQYHDEWKRMGGDIVLSVDEYVDELDKRGLVEYVGTITTDHPVDTRRDIDSVRVLSA